VRNERNEGERDAKVLADNARVTAGSGGRGEGLRQISFAPKMRADRTRPTKERPDRLPGSPDPHAIIFCVIRSLRYAPAAVSPR